MIVAWGREVGEGERRKAAREAQGKQSIIAIIDKKKSDESEVEQWEWGGRLRASPKILCDFLFLLPAEEVGVASIRKIPGFRRRCPPSYLSTCLQGCQMKHSAQGSRLKLKTYY